MTVIASRATPAVSSSASAPSSSLLVTAPLKRLTTMPTARRPPCGFPRARRSPPGRRTRPRRARDSLQLLVGDSSGLRHRIVSRGSDRLRSPPQLLLLVVRLARRSSSGGASGQRSLTLRLLRRAPGRNGDPGGAACGRASRASPRGSGGSRRSARTSIGSCATTSSPKPAIPEIFFGLFVRTRIVERPRSARICEPIPYSRASAAKPRLEVRLDRVEPLLLQLVRLQLVQQADPAALLRHVEEDAAALLLDPAERQLELLAAVAAERVEDVAGEALGVDAHEHVLLAGDLALHERDVVLAGQRLAEGDGRELRRRRSAGRTDVIALDELLVAAPVLDQVGDRDHLQPVRGAVLDQVGHARHRPVVVHDLADDAGRDQAREPREVDRRLGLAGALEHAAAAGAQREDVARLDEVARPRGRVDRDLDRVRRGRARRCRW